MERKLIMPFGKYKGTPVSELSDGYLVQLYLHNKLPKWLKEYAESNVNILKVTLDKKTKTTGSNKN